MHRLSRISATLTAKKSELDAANDANDETFPRPNVLPISNGDAGDGKQAVKKTDEEWFELHSVTPSISACPPLVTAFDSEIPRSTPDSVKDRPNEKASRSPSSADADRTVVHNDPAVDIEIMEKSLISLLEDLRSGRLNALSEERLNQMRKARKDMEELTAFHVKLHRQQVSNVLSSSEGECLDEQYDALFQRLDELHSSMRIMSFGSTSPDRTQSRSSIPDETTA